VNARYRPITRLGLGGTGLGDMYHATSDTAAMATVDAAWDAGIRSSPRRSPAPAARSTCGATRRWWTSRFRTRSGKNCGPKRWCSRKPRCRTGDPFP